MILKIVSVLLIIFILTLYFCNENFSSYYLTYNELTNSNDLNNGWIPSIIPIDSKEIYEVHNIDNNNTFIGFDFTNVSWIDSVKLQCKLASKDSLNSILRQINNPSRPNWFITDSELKNNNVIVFQNDDYYLICDSINKHGFILRY